MGGFLGIGNSSAKTDRGQYLAGQGGLLNMFNWALPQGQQQNAAGVEALKQPQQYWQSQLTAGRQQTLQNAAPAVTAAQDQGDALQRAAGVLGTGRSAGTAAQQREASTTTASQIDQIVNQSQFSNQQAAATGLTGIGNDLLKNANFLLGLGASGLEDYISNAAQSRDSSFKINQSVQEQWGQVAGLILGAAS